MPQRPLNKDAHGIFSAGILAVGTCCFVLFYGGMAEHLAATVNGGFHEWHCREICLESAQRDDSR